MLRLYSTECTICNHGRRVCQQWKCVAYPRNHFFPFFFFFPFFLQQLPNKEITFSSLLYLYSPHRVFHVRASPIETRQSRRAERIRLVEWRCCNGGRCNKALIKKTRRTKRITIIIVIGLTIPQYHHQYAEIGRAFIATAIGLPPNALSALTSPAWESARPFFAIWPGILTQIGSFFW